MNYCRLDITKKIHRILFIVATIFFVLSTSCAVKSSIKSWADIQSSTAQAPIKNGNLFSGSNTYNCTSNEITNTQISQTISFQASDYAPTVLFTVAFMLLFSITLRSLQVHPHYVNLKISSSIPIFIRVRNLQI